MKKSLLAFAFAIPLSLSLSGCVISVGGEDGHGFGSNFEDREYENRKNIARIKLNSTYSNVYNTLGVADFTETYQRNDSVVKVLYYRTHRQQKDGMTTKDECTYLNFVDGILTETGNGQNYARNTGE